MTTTVPRISKYLFYIQLYTYLQKTGQNSPSHLRAEAAVAHVGISRVCCLGFHSGPRQAVPLSIGCANPLLGLQEAETEVILTKEGQGIPT